MKSFVTFIALLLFVQVADCQIIMSERIQYSQLAKSDDKQLFLIDFWATWCGPCIMVSKYLNVLQEKYAKDFYVVSLTDESPETVRKFIEKHPTKLAVSLDYDRQNFKNYAVKNLPRGVLLNADGDKIWEGNPADLKPEQLEKFLRKNPKKIPIYDFLKYKSYQLAENQAISFDGDFLLNEKKISVAQFPQIEQISDNIVKIQGSLSQIFAFLLDVSPFQVEIPQKNQTFELFYNQNVTKLAVLEQIQQKLDLILEKKEKNGDFLEATLLSYDHLWDKKQIEWGFSTPKFLIDDSQITADNLTIKEVLALLGELKQLPIKLLNNPQYVKNEGYDWQFHYEYQDLMLNNFEEYGFKTDLKSGNYDFYNFLIKSE